MFGVTEVLIVVLILLVLFGATRLPGVGKGLGGGIRGFLDAIKGKDKTARNDEPKPPQKTD